ncbi:hypothetical protein ACFFRR_001832 [Megaselia abdita]
MSKIALVCLVVCLVSASASPTFFTLQKTFLQPALGIGESQSSGGGIFEIILSKLQFFANKWNPQVITTTTRRPRPKVKVDVGVSFKSSSTETTTTSTESIPSSGDDDFEEIKKQLDTTTSTEKAVVDEGSSGDKDFEDIKKELEMAMEKVLDSGGLVNVDVGVASKDDSSSKNIADVKIDVGVASVNDEDTNAEDITVTNSENMGDVKVDVGVSSMDIFSSSDNKDESKNEESINSDQEDTLKNISITNSGSIAGADIADVKVDVGVSSKDLTSTNTDISLGDNDSEEIKETEHNSLVSGSSSAKRNEDSFEEANKQLGMAVVVVTNEEVSSTTENLSKKINDVFLSNDDDIRDREMSLKTSNEISPTKYDDTNDTGLKEEVWGNADINLFSERDISLKIDSDNSNSIQIRKSNDLGSDKFEDISMTKPWWNGTNIQEMKDK